MKLAYVGGRGYGRRALASQMARDYARDLIAKGTDPKSYISFASPDGVQTVTLESLLEES